MSYEHLFLDSKGAHSGAALAPQRNPLIAEVTAFSKSADYYEEFAPPSLFCFDLSAGGGGGKGPRQPTLFVKETYNAEEASAVCAVLRFPLAALDHVTPVKLASLPATLRQRCSEYAMEHTLELQFRVRGGYCLLVIALETAQQLKDWETTLRVQRSLVKPRESEYHGE